MATAAPGLALEGLFAAQSASGAKMTKVALRAALAALADIWGCQLWLNVDVWVWELKGLTKYVAIV